MSLLRRLCPIVLVAAFAAASGCGYIEELKLPLITPSGEDVTEDPAPRMHYPDDAEIAEPLQVEVVRVGDAIRLDNYTVNSIGEAQLWLNHQYGANIKGLPVGSSKPISLESFYNQHGEPYPVGGFLTPDRDKALVLADLYVDGRLHKLTVRLTEGWQKP